MKDLNVINCTAYSNGINSPLEYLNITTPAEFKVVMDLLCYYDSKKKTSTISRTGIETRTRPLGDRQAHGVGVPCI
ncbi:hypothetical protein SAMN02910353_01440 [Ruminococcus sp. YRD2003]|uniref:hypothetical protein n=1 Tax=Ruminococcus sp. YRD2003 TaxID=1452313 RepID=UPI0008D10705|nr:hypothetical protein SAMN02910353_01440 [Ruminococcus flavefaciens]